MARALALVLLLSTGCLPGPELPPDDADEPRDQAYFLERLRRPELLAALDSGRTALASTWDRTGGNFDGWDFKDVDGGSNVLLDVDGPGVIHRIFTGLVGPDVEGSRIVITLDEDDAPLFDMPVDSFFSPDDGPFPAPLVTDLSYQGVMMPIPYAEHVRVELRSDLELPNWGAYWQIAYTTYPDEIEVQSTLWPAAVEVIEEIDRVTRAWNDALSTPDAPTAWSDAASWSIRAGQGETLVLGGCGRVEQLRLAVEPRTPETLMGLRLQISWDGVDEASVDVPVGHFFGHGDYAADDPGVPFDSLFLGVTQEVAYTRLPMPFSDGARLRLRNFSAVDLEDVTLQLHVTPCVDPPADEGRLHATWHTYPAAVDGSPHHGPLRVPAHLVLDREARGKYVGTLLAIDWPHEQWWGEGDWLFWTDEDGWPPRYHGTGTEEYFNSGYTVFDRLAISGFVKMRPGPVTLYSFHPGDAFPFEDRIHVAVETMGLFDGDDILHAEHRSWTSTAFWYADEPGAAGSAPG